MPFTTKICNFANYYPFGMQHTGTAGSYDLSSDYRYGFNGKEKDDEIKGEANSLDYGFRIYDPRVGKFLSVDPFTHSYPKWTPYSYAMNRPIDGIDIDGLEWGEKRTVDASGKTIVERWVFVKVINSSTMSSASLHAAKQLAVKKLSQMLTTEDKENNIKYIMPEGNIKFVDEQSNINTASPDYRQNHFSMEFVDDAEPTYDSGGEVWGKTNGSPNKKSPFDFNHASINHMIIQVKKENNSTKIRKVEDIVFTMIHELGHTTNLMHIHEQPIEGNKDQEDFATSNEAASFRTKPNIMNDNDKERGFIVGTFQQQMISNEIKRTGNGKSNSKVKEKK